LSFNQIRELAIEAHSQGIDFSSTVYSLEEAIQLSSVSNLAFIKVASMDIDNLGLLNEVCRLGLPVVLSSGMASMNELERAVETCLNTGNQKLALLHCVSLYPTMTEDLNLLNIVQLRGTFPGIEIGLSDHSSGVLAGAVAVALGVRLIEKHLTLDKSTPGFDNSMALDGDQMSSYVANCVEAWKSLGGRDRNVSPSELDQRKKMRRSCVYSRDLKAGEVLLGDFIEFRRPGVGIPIVASHGLIGRVLQVDVLEGDLISEDHFD
jgi:N-acetylneuraminate synthase